MKKGKNNFKFMITLLVLMTMLMLTIKSAMAIGVVKPYMEDNTMNIEANEQKTINFQIQNMETINKVIQFGVSVPSPMRANNMFNYVTSVSIVPGTSRNIAVTFKSPLEGLYHVKYYYQEVGYGSFEIEARAEGDFYIQVGDSDEEFSVNDSYDTELGLDVEVNPDNNTAGLVVEVNPDSNEDNNDDNDNKDGSSSDGSSSGSGLSSQSNVQDSSSANNPDDKASETESQNDNRRSSQVDQGSPRPRPTSVAEGLKNAIKGKNLNIMVPVFALILLGSLLALLFYYKNKYMEDKK